MSNRVRVLFSPWPEHLAASRRCCPLHHRAACQNTVLRYIKQLCISETVCWGKGQVGMSHYCKGEGCKNQGNIITPCVCVRVSFCKVWRLNAAICECKKICFCYNTSQHMKISCTRFCWWADRNFTKQHFIKDFCSQLGSKSLTDPSADVKHQAFLVKTLLQTSSGTVWLQKYRSVLM